MIKLHTLCVGCVFISLSIINSSIKAQALDFNFSFTGDQGTNPGTVTGLIQGLKDNITSTPTDVIIYQNTLGITPGTILNHTGFSQFTVNNGNITFVNGSYYDDNFDHQIYLNLYNSNNMGGNLNGLFNELNQESNYNYNYSDLELGGGTYTPAGTIAPTPTYYKLSAYGGIAPASNGKGLEPVKINSILVPFTISPNSNTIYIDGTANSLDYVLDTSETKDGIATPQDLQTITKLTQTLPISESAQSILDNTQLQLNLLGNANSNRVGIKAQFNPIGNIIGSVSLGSLAKVLGYSGFDWIQEISQTPVTVNVYSVFPYQNLPNNLVDSAGTILTDNGVFNDYLNGGNRICNIAYIYTPISNYYCSTSKADTKPYYFDIPGFGGIPNSDADLLKYISNTSLGFVDTPTTFYIPSGEYSKFSTQLVGLLGTDASESKPIIRSNGTTFGFNWTSNYSCISLDFFSCGGIELLGGNFLSNTNSSDLTTGDWTGGVTITDAEHPLQDLPLNVLQALSKDGVQIPPNLLNPQPVAEPSSSIGTLILGVFGVGHIWKRRRSRRAN